MTKKENSHEVFSNTSFFIYLVTSWAKALPINKKWILRFSSLDSMLDPRRNTWVAFYPLFQDPPLSWVGLLMLYLTEAVPEDWYVLGISLGQLPFWFWFSITSFRHWGTKKFGGSKAGMVGHLTRIDGGHSLSQYWVFLALLFGLSSVR